MPEYDYGGESFGDADTYHSLLAFLQETKVGLIEMRSVQNRIYCVSKMLSDLSAGPIALVLVLVLAGGTVAYITFEDGGGGINPGEFRDVGEVHDHGTINVTINGQTLDFSRSKYQHPRKHPAFHFEGGNGQIWHVHARGVTLVYAMGTLGINVTESSVTFDGTTYHSNDSKWEIIVEVNGNSVNPEQYVLQSTSEKNYREGDHIRIVVREVFEPEK